MERVCGCGQLINTSAGINTYNPPDSILGIDLYLFLCFCLHLSPPSLSVTHRWCPHWELKHTWPLHGGTSCCRSACVLRLGQWWLGRDGGSPHAANHPHHTRQSKRAFQLLLMVLNIWLADFSGGGFAQDCLIYSVVNTKNQSPYFSPANGIKVSTVVKYARSQITVVINTPTICSRQLPSFCLFLVFDGCRLSPLPPHSCASTFR